MRPSKERYYLEIARVVASRSTCLRTHYGAVIVLDDRIVSTGYNGSMRGQENCCDTGKCARANVPSRERYELCRSVHAEANAIINARCNLGGAEIYIAGERDGNLIHYPKTLPCMMCYRLIVNAGITYIYTQTESDWVRHGVDRLGFLDTGTVEV